MISIARIVSLDDADYRVTIHDLAARGLSGGIVYDALIAKAASAAGVDVLLTLNPRHFRRVELAEGIEIRIP